MSCVIFAYNKSVAGFEIDVTKQNMLHFQLQKPLHASLSYSSSCVSASEFFDAEEYQLHQNAQGVRDRSDTSSEAGSLTSEEGSVSSENSEAGTEYTPAQSSKY